MTVSSTSSGFNRRQVLTAVYLAAVAFCTYASIFAFRKPFTVAVFEPFKFIGVSYQTLLIISQVLGYMLSKFAGIRFIAQLQRRGRWKSSLFLMVTAWFSLLVFALVPPPWGMLCFFVNGFVLGFMWGITFSYVEGRRTTDFIGVVLAVSFIFAGGFSRSVGKWVMLHWGVNSFWMPFVTACLFTVPLLFFYYLLERAAPPDAADEAERTIRRPMNAEQRRQFLLVFAPGVVAFVVIYLLLTVLRDLRDNYMANLWNELGYADNAAVFARTETITSLVILLIIGTLVLVRNNRTALKWIHVLLLLGFAVTFAATVCFRLQWLSGAAWMQLSGLGLYMGYILFNSVYFERLLATFRVAGNAGFLIYVADAWGYLGSVGVMLTKELVTRNSGWVVFYSNTAMICTAAGLLAAAWCSWYFLRKASRWNHAATLTSPTPENPGQA